MFVLLYYVAVLLISMMATFAMFSDGHTTRDASKEEDEDGLGFFSSPTTSSSSSSTPRLFEVSVPAPKDSALERLRASITSDSQREQLSFLEQHCCVLPTRAKDVEVLHQPCDFLSELQKQIRNAQRSIIISALYVGDGPLSRSFVAALEEKVEERMAAYTQQQQQQRNDDDVVELEPLHITILLDYNRMHDRRNLVTLRTLLHRAHEAELRQLPIHVHLHLFQSPCRWNRIFALFGRAKEALGVQHTKIFCFDDQHTILTGANLSDDYFSTRMDRYVVLKHNKCVAVWFRQLVERLVECSHPVMCRDTYRIQFDDEKEQQVMQESNARQRGREALRMVCEMVLPRGDAATTTTTTTTSSSSSPTSPTSPTLHARSNLIILPNALGADPSVDANAFVAKTREVMKRFARDVSLQFSGVAYTSFTRNNNNNNNHDDDDDDEYDSVFFPTLQVGRGGVHHDGLIVQGVLQRLQATQQLFLTSPYLNLYSAFTDEVLRGRSTVHVITASVRTNGWHGQKGMAGWIPFFYLQLERAFFFLMEANACLHRVHLHEFHVDGLTYHAKGLWLAQTTTTTTPTPPTTTTSSSNTCPKEMKKDDDDDDVYVATPYLVAYGSTNYGYRSVHKDVEAEGFLYTSNQHLRDVFREELQFLLAKSEHVATNKFVHGAKGRFQPIVSLVAQLGQDFL